MACIESNIKRLSGCSFLDEKVETGLTDTLPVQLLQEKMRFSFLRSTNNDVDFSTL
jgi:hypothetical protein